MKLRMSKHGGFLQSRSFTGNQEAIFMQTLANYGITQKFEGKNLDKYRRRLPIYYGFLMVNYRSLMMLYLLL